MQLLLFDTFNSNSKLKRGEKDLNSSVSNLTPVIQDFVRNLLDFYCAYLGQMEVRLCLIIGKCSFLFLFGVWLLNCKGIWQTFICMLL